jgi:hypothetical protein
MTQPTSPFSNLSKLIATPTTAPFPAPTNTPVDEDKSPRNLGNKETSKQPSKEASVPAAPPLPSPTPIPLIPDPPSKQNLTRKQTFEFTKKELDFMAEIKFQLRHLGVTKNELVQTGLELLAKDYAANKEQSYLVRKFAVRSKEEEFA